MRSVAFAKQRYSEQYCCLEPFLLLEGNNRKKIIVSFWCSVDLPYQSAITPWRWPCCASVVQILNHSCSDYLVSSLTQAYNIKVACVMGGQKWETVWVHEIQETSRHPSAVTPIMVQFWQQKGRAKDLGLPSVAHGSALGHSLKFTFLPQSVTDTKWAKTRQCGLILVRDCQNGDVPVVEHPPIYSWAANGSSLVVFCQGMHFLWRCCEK